MSTGSLNWKSQSQAPGLLFSDGVVSDERDRIYACLRDHVGDYLVLPYVLIVHTAGSQEFDLFAVVHALRLQLLDESLGVVEVEVRE